MFMFNVAKETDPIEFQQWNGFRKSFHSGISGI